MNKNRRIVKEKITEKRILVRDLFCTVQKKFREKMNKRKLPKNILNIVYENDI